MKEGDDQKNNSNIRVITIEDLAANLEMYIDLIRNDGEEVILLFDDNQSIRGNYPPEMAVSAVQSLGS